MRSNNTLGPPDLFLCLFYYPFTLVGVCDGRDFFPQGDYFVVMAMNLFSLNYNYLGKPWVYKPMWRIPVLDCADEIQQAFPLVPPDFFLY